MALVLASGCSEDEAKTIQKIPKKTYDYITYLPVEESPIDIFVDDLNRDGRKDVAVTLHALNASQIFLQEAIGQYRAGQHLQEFGFHPGDWLRWPIGDDQPTYIGAAEGINALINFQVDDQGEVNIVSKLAAARPRNVAAFTWPGWGWSLVTSPFDAGSLEFFKGYDPGKGSYAQRLGVSLDVKSNQESIRRAERVTLADIDNDGIDEILFASHTTGEVFNVSHPKKGKDVRPRVGKLFDLGNGAPKQVLAKDLNGDKAVDLLVPDQTTPYQIHILLNNAKGGFRETKTPLSFAVNNGIRYADLQDDRDGMRYMAVLGYGAIALYQLPIKWDGLQSVPMRWVKIAERGMSSDVVLNDMNNDGWLDVVLGYVSAEHCVAIIHGPLWQHMEELSKNAFMFN